MRVQNAARRHLMWLGVLCLPFFWPGPGQSLSVASSDDGHEHGDHGQHLVPYFPSTKDMVRQGFVRVINHSDQAGQVDIMAIDDMGQYGSPVTLAIAARETVHFNSTDLENGNTDKNLRGRAGTTTENVWRLALSSELDVQVLAYLRTSDGFLTSMHDLVPTVGDQHRVAIFNPGSNINQVSWLRLINTGDAAAEVEIEGIDGAGNAGESPIELTIASKSARMLSAQALETGRSDFVGSLGNGEGKWQLNVDADGPVLVMSLLATPTGHITNLSSSPSPSRTESAREVFQEKISEPIVQGRCVACHSEGGASGTTRLVFVHGDQSGHETINFNVFENFLASDDHDGHDHDDGESHRQVILYKVQGMNNHGGGPQIQADSAEFHNLEHFLMLLERQVQAYEDHDEDSDHHDHSE